MPERTLPPDIKNIEGHKEKLSEIQTTLSYLSYFANMNGEGYYEEWLRQIGDEVSSLQDWLMYGEEQ